MEENGNKQMGLWERHFHWRVLLQWDVFGYLLATALSVAALLLVFDQYVGANICFVISAALIVAKIIHVAATSDDPAWQRWIFTFVLCGLVGVAIVETIRGVNKWAVRHREVALAQPKQPEKEIVEQHQTDAQPSIETQPKHQKQLKKDSGDKSHQQSNRVLHPITEMSEGERFALARKLSALSGNSISLVRIGQKPELNVAFEQLLEAFKRWTISTTSIGVVGLSGVNFPDGPYLTGPDVNDPIVTQVYSAFHDVGIDLPLVPAAFMGPRQNVSVVIILH